MTRYDWPAPVGSRDDPSGRAGYLSRFRPQSDLAMEAAPAPKRATRAHGRAVPHTLPAGADHLWFPVGPSVMVGGQATGNPNVAGRVRDLQVEPTIGMRVYAASATGGVWYSADRGDSWRPLDEWQESPDLAAVGNVANALACGAVHVIWGAPADGSLDDVWVGTGELTGGAGGSPGGQASGIGFLHAVGPATGGAWSIEKGAAPTGPGADPTTLRGHSIMRIAGDPGDPATLVAGTTNGIYVLSGGTWTRVAASLPGGLYPVDVLVTRPSPTTARIWAAGYSTVQYTDVAAPIVPGTVTALTNMALPNVLLVPPPPPPPGGVAGSPERTRIQFAANANGTTVYLLGRRITAAAEKLKQKAAHLWSVTASATPPAATGLPGLPVYLFGERSDQSGYDMCIAAHPTVAGRVYVGGSGLTTSGEWNAALYRCETTATACTATLIGVGVHADEHMIRVGPAAPTVPTKRTLWVGCDGGIFRSESDGDPGSFVARNDGLAVLEPGFVASHPTNAGLLAAGFQDNGTAVRVGDTVWKQTFGGDGGGLIYDPGAPAPGRYFRQYIKADWESYPPGSIPPVKRRAARVVGSLKTSESIESDASMFYSGADAISLGGDTHLAIGSDRVWYSRDWGRSWVTLPTATDPRGGDNSNLRQDVMFVVTPPGAPTHYSDRVGSTESCSTTYVGTAALGDGILAVKFAQAPNNGTNLVLRCLALYPFGLVWMTGTRAAAGSGAFIWTQATAATPLPTQAFRQPNTPAETTDFTNGAALAFLPAVARMSATTLRGLASDVAVHDPALGTLGSCYVTTTGLPNFTTPPGDRIDTLWFFDGTSKWIPTGLRTTNPSGTWTGTQVTAPALGVVVDPDDKNIVYVGTSVGVVKGVLTIGAGPTYSWAWQQHMNGLPEAAVQDLSIHRFPKVATAGVPTVKLLRAALQARGVWETDLGNVSSSPLTYLRLYPTDTRRRLPTPLSGDTTSGETAPPHWDESPDIVVDTTGSAGGIPPTEAELFTLPSAGRPGSVGRVLLSNRHPVVHVLVHQRWRDAAAEADVRVALIRHALPANGVVPLGGLWPALVTAAAAAAPPASLPDGWRSAGAVMWKNPLAPVDNRLPRAVSFDLDLSGDVDGSAFVLLAVVMSGTNQISPADLRLTPTTNATTADQLVVTSAHVAARSIELTSAD
jgi:hypothetical protein